jgi:hypothetical protein
LVAEHTPQILLLDLLMPDHSPRNSKDG